MADHRDTSVRKCSDGLQGGVQSEGWATLANGTVETFDVYGVTLLWDGQPRYVDADAVGPTPLASMYLLDRHNLNIDVEDGGRVVIQAKE